MDLEARLRELHDRFVPRFDETGLAGDNTRHSRKDNLQAIGRLLEGHWHYTFGIQGLTLGSAEEVLRQTASITGCSSDIHYEEGGGHISAEKTFKALCEATERLKDCRGRPNQRVFLGTGHPGSLLDFYLRLQVVLEKNGIEVFVPRKGFLDATREVDSIGRVSVLEDRASILHSHEVEVGNIALGEYPREVSLAFCDHAYAAACLNQSVPLIAIMDTNDSAFAVAQAQGMDLTVIPMDDNRPLGAYKPALELIEAILAGGG